MGSGNDRHIMVYVKWSIVEAWKKQEKAHRRYLKGNVGERAPYAYGSAQPRLYQLGKPGAVVWVVSSPRFGSRLLPPTIIARLSIRKCIDRNRDGYGKNDIPSYFDKKWNYVVLAERPPASFYLPLNNAFEAITTECLFKGQARPLQECRHCRSLRVTTKSLFSGLPSHLQTIRELSPGKEAKLEVFAQSVLAGKNVFLSYKHKEARRQAEYLAEKIIERGIGCWWDEWNLPLGTTDDLYVDLPDSELKANLIDGIRQSAYMIALVTKKYHKERFWPHTEWELALTEFKDEVKRRTRKFRVIEVLLDGESHGGDNVDVVDARKDRSMEWVTRVIKQISEN